MNLLILCRVAAVLLPFTTLVTAQANALNLSSDLERLGIASRNWTSNDRTVDSGALLEAAVRYATMHGITRVTVNRGTYYFSGSSPLNSRAHVILGGYTTPLTIDLQGSDLYFTNPEKFGLWLSNVSNMVLENFTMDLTQLHYTQVRVTDVDPVTRIVKYSTQPGWQRATQIRALNSAFVASGTPPTFAYFFRNGQPWTRFTRIPVMPGYDDGAMTLERPALPEAISEIRAGDVGVLHIRAGNPILLAANTNNCTLRNIKIYSGFVGLRTLQTSNCTFERIYVMPRLDTDRLISTVADGITITRGIDQTIRYCRSIRTCDDAISPHAFVYASTKAKLSPNQVLVQGDPLTELANYTQPLLAGIPLIFERASDGTIVATSNLVSATAPSSSAPAQVTLTLDRDVSVDLTGTYVYSTDPFWRGVSLRIERCNIQEGGWARGISVWGLRGPTLYGNYIRRSSMAGIALMHTMHPNDWVTPPVIDAQIINNVIDGAITSYDGAVALQLGAIQTSTTRDVGGVLGVPVMKDITVRGNFIAEPSRSGIWMADTAGAIIESNYVFRPNKNAQPTLAFLQYRSSVVLPIVKMASTGVVETGNMVDQSAIRIWVTDPSDRTLAAYAPDTKVRLHALGLGEAAGLTVSLIDADARSWPLPWTTSGCHSIEATLPSGTGLGGARIGIVSGAQHFWGTLYVDSQDNFPCLNSASYQLTPATTSVRAEGGGIPILIVTEPGKPRPLRTSDTFVTLDPPGSGTGVVTANFSRNVGAARTVIVEIGDQPIVFSQAGASDPDIKLNPVSHTLSGGSLAVLSTSVTGALSYEWSFNGSVLTGETGATLVIPSVDVGTQGSYFMTATGLSGAATSAPATLRVAGNSAVSRLTNLSCRAQAGTGTNTLIVGFAVARGAAGRSKPMLIRASGPALAEFGVSGTLADPTLTLYDDKNVLLASNAGWAGDTQLTAVASAVGAFPWTNALSKDSAFSIGQSAGAYSVQVQGNSGMTGVTLIEVYDADSSANFESEIPRLANLSTRVQVGGADILIAGFVIAGPTSKSLLIRGSGPALSPFGVSDTMRDPKLELFDTGNNMRATNSGWNGNPQIASVSSRTGAFPWESTSSDSAVLTTLEPGLYTIQLSSISGTGGVALLELFEIP